MVLQLDVQVTFTEVMLLLFRPIDTKHVYAAALGAEAKLDALSPTLPWPEVVLSREVQDQVACTCVVQTRHPLLFRSSHCRQILGSSQRHSVQCANNNGTDCNILTLPDQCCVGRLTCDVVGHWHAGSDQAAFLKAAHKTVYGATDQGGSLADRVGSRKFYSDRRADGAAFRR